MSDPDFRNPLQNENFKEIEDVIDARKRLGQYNVYKNTNPLNIRCVYSSVRNSHDANRMVKFDEGSLISADKETIGGINGIRHTDSEITIVRVKCTGESFKRKLNKWDMNDIAIPGDGTHLGESPSLVNLATLVAQNVQCEGDDEYLVPLSSWDPFIKNEDILPNMKCSSDSKINERYFIRSSSTDPNIPCKLECSSSSTQIEGDFEETVSQYRRPSWTGKLSKFWREHCHKIKSLNESDLTKEDTDDQNKNDDN